ncbi:UNVERIFIED_CONTAM: tRNA N(3)-methylcytidine methyltransferase METTL6 [Sesamum radiatum]|uniref:tRNA N(3)-methylcytidine methyltransferase METTL6 n=1 Tax=Sesamum radiatum TaxID=300843 RepID=A0AAW2L0H2_SESRA
MGSTSNAQISISENQQPQQPKIQIYSPSNDEVSAFWREKYEKDAKKYWDIFYKRHQDKFFKDRHYLDKEWGHHFSVGCGAGNTIFPLLATYPDIFIHACDFSPRAVNLVKMHKDFTEARVNAFVCDLTIDDLCLHVAPSSVDIVTMIFVLSAVSPEKMPMVVQNIRKVLKPNGRILFRDYATGDLAQERFTGKEQKISENFYVRGDGTRAFYFSDEFLRNIFKENGFNMEEHVLCCKQVENRSKEIVMNRRWVQAVFQQADTNSSSGASTGNEPTRLRGDCDKRKDDINGFEIDMSEGMAFEMFGISSSSEEIIELTIRDCFFKIKVLSKEYQHTCTSTGLMLWESARLMASVLAANQEIVAGKRVLELGCGCGGICSMVAARSANLVVATDGDTKALDLLTENIASNLKSPSLDSLKVKKLEWGNGNDIEAIKQLNEKGFDIIIGTDVTYIPEAIIPLFATARELISTTRVTENNTEPGLILCHVLRRVDEPSILSAASKYGFSLADRWPDHRLPNSSYGGIIKSWFSDECQYEVPSTALNIMYFHIA